jgi:hypothetical protein
MLAVFISLLVASCFASAESAYTWVQQGENSCKDQGGQTYNYCSKDMLSATETMVECQAAVDTLDQTKVAGLGWQTSSNGGGICVIHMMSQDACSGFQSDGWNCVCWNYPGNGLPEPSANGNPSYPCYVRSAAAPAPTLVLDGSYCYSSGTPNGGNSGYKVLGNLLNESLESCAALVQAEDSSAMFFVYEAKYKNCFLHKEADKRRTICTEDSGQMGFHHNFDTYRIDQGRRVLESQQLDGYPVLEALRDRLLRL